jgi:hypothetical protein
VDPTIAAAWITGGVGALGIIGTMTTAIVGSRSTKRSTEATIAAGTNTTAATLTAAREDRLWEKRCAAYETALEALLYRQRKRQHDLRMYRLDKDSEEKLRDFFGGYEPPGWFEAQARLVAYASDAVLDAYETSHRADLEVWGRYRQWQILAEESQLAVESGRPGAAHDGQVMIEARRKINPALGEADAKDEILRKSIRDELGSKPQAATLPARRPTQSRRL